MTMPVKIYAERAFFEQEIAAYESRCDEGNTPYIRADIAEDLARALVHAMEWVDSEATRIKMQKVMDAYNSITP